jgi:lysophospholipase L1-like esterase
VKKPVLHLMLIALSTAATICSAADAARVVAVSSLPSMRRLDANIPGRTLHSSDGDTYQWPGLYFEAYFDGPSVLFKVGPGEVILRVLVDGAPVTTLLKPAAGVYEIGSLARRKHSARIEVLTESQAAPNVFGGFLYSTATKPLRVPARTRQIEFIGDSHTVGYGNTSKTRDCTEDDVWSKTDTSSAFGPEVARHYDADYQINAISGRGIVRNYDGSPGDPLPVAYPFVLLDRAARFENVSWRPQVVVVALGTNDFSTPLHAGEKWATRDALHTDFESTYAKFLEALRARNPAALFVIWATDTADSEIQSEVRKVVEQRRSRGDSRLDFVPVGELAMTGCNWHPSVADDEAIAAKLIQLIDARNPWRGS